MNQRVILKKTHELYKAVCIGKYHNDIVFTLYDFSNSGAVSSRSQVNSDLLATQVILVVVQFLGLVAHSRSNAKCEDQELACCGSCLLWACKYHRDTMKSPHKCQVTVKQNTVVWG